MDDTVVLKLSARDKARLGTLARERGVSEEELARQMVWQRLHGIGRPAGPPAKPSLLQRMLGRSG